MEEIKQANLVTVPFKCLMYAVVDIDTGEMTHIELPGEAIERASNEVYDDLGEVVDDNTAAEAEDIAWNGDWSSENFRWV